MLVIGNNNIKPHIHATHSQSLKDDSTSSQLGRTTLFTFLYFHFFFLRYQHIHKRQRGYIMFPPASVGFSV